jgi:Cytochrome C oxidase, cbb3-type, subunit III
MTISNRFYIPGLLLTVLLLTGCRGSLSKSPPVHVVLNMDFQEKFEAQEENTFFENGMAMRPPVEGTVARGQLNDEPRYFTGRNPDGSFVSSMPISLTTAVMERGQDRYEIFCAVCHGSAGDGQGIIMTGNYGYVPAPDYHTDARRAQPDGFFYDAISRGIRTMPGYAAQIPVADRWAIVAYIRALQRSQHAGVEDVPVNER